VYLGLFYPGRLSSAVDGDRCKTNGGGQPPARLETSDAGLRQDTSVEWA
jgi:hypothetical protein